jgi:hypothetical protein
MTALSLYGCLSGAWDRADAQPVWCASNCGGGKGSCKGTLEIRDRLDKEARERGWTDEHPKNYWKQAAEEREQILRDYCNPERCQDLGLDISLCQAR